MKFKPIGIFKDANTRMPRLKVSDYSTEDYDAVELRSDIKDRPIAFGDFSFYWIVERESFSVIVLKEKFIESGQIGYMGYEFLDGKLIRPDAIKVLCVEQDLTDTIESEDDF